MALNYPPKPWKNGQRHMVLPEMEFMWSSSMKKWVPITPGYENEEQLQSSFGVSTLVELAAQFKKEIVKVTQIESRVDSDIKLSGRIWKKATKPNFPRANDIWIDPVTGKVFSYNDIADTWVQH